MKKALIFLKETKVSLGERGFRGIATQIAGCSNTLFSR
jgi:hypothetical protein